MISLTRLDVPIARHLTRLLGRTLTDDIIRTLRNLFLGPQSISPPEIDYGPVSVLDGFANPKETAHPASASETRIPMIALREIRMVHVLGMGY